MSIGAWFITIVFGILAIALLAGIIGLAFITRGAVLLVVIPLLAVLMFYADSGYADEIERLWNRIRYWRRG